MKKVKALKVYRVKETGAIAHTGHLLNYPEERAQQLADGGWVEIIGDSDELETELAALIGVPDGDAPPVDGEEGAQADREDNADPALPEDGEQPEEQQQPATPVVPEKAEVITGQPEKVDEAGAKAKRGRKPKSEQQ